MFVLESLSQLGHADANQAFTLLTGLAALVTSLSALIWSLRRKP